MQNGNNKLLFSATDLNNYLDCPHLTSLSLIDLDKPLEKDEPDDQLKLIQNKGIIHEKQYLEKLQKSGKSIIDLTDIRGTYDEKQNHTVLALNKAPDVIFQAVLYDEPFLGYADFLMKVKQPSTLGDYSYEVLDTKLAKRSKPYFIIQLCLYSQLLEKLQGIKPEKIHVALGNGETETFYVKDYDKYFNQLNSQFLDHVRKRIDTYPEPCDHCSLCQFRSICEQQRIEDDHLYQVANIRKSQIKRLKVSGITTLKELANTQIDKVKRIGEETFIKLKKQAELQFKKRETGENQIHFLNPKNDNLGFNAIPQPDEGDLFFDIEGDPLYDDGLEYLFGIYYLDGKDDKFLDLWAHNHSEEKESFEKLIHFFIERLNKYPNMHIFHYASYEETAMKKLMSKYNTMDAEVDHFLRQKVFVDLFKVVRHSIQVSEPSYSIKNIETFYMEKREAEVKDAGASIVYYEKYIETGEQKILDDILTYNYDDCRSLLLLRNWLLELKSKHAPETISDVEREDFSSANHPDIEKLKEYEQKLLGGLPETEEDYTQEHKIRKLLNDLANFYRREAKPQWWAMFSRQSMTTEELIDDGECIGGLVKDVNIPPIPIKRSSVVTFSFPPQEYKMKKGDTPKIAETLAGAGEIYSLDHDKCIIQLKRGNARGEYPDELNLAPSGPIDTGILKESLWSFIDSYIELMDKQDRAHPCILDFLERKLPNIKTVKSGDALIKSTDAKISDYVKLVKEMDDTYLFIQGPPGTGKTYTASHVILELMKSGNKIAVSGNSHKVINNVLSAVEDRADEQQFEFKGIKKTSHKNMDSFFEGKLIENSGENDYVMGAANNDANLIAGSAWLFARFGEPIFDYLFIDEAGQISLANFIAVARCAKNVVLIGDQMQLAQPIQGVHPGETGKSVLDYLLQGRHTIPDNEGLLLSTTYRMHPNICNFISDAIYDGRIKSLDELINQQIILNGTGSKKIPENGIICELVDHEDSTQRSDEEADHVKKLYDMFLQLNFRDKDKKISKITSENILIVSPYNMQVNNLMRVLGEDARVGTVDKFQGQEAEIVIISMATSNPEDIPRGLEFLYSQNRLNVSLSRARCLSILVASPKLFNARCSSIDQMKLVNTLCWVKEYSEN